MKRAILMALVIPAAIATESLPIVIGTIPNRDNSKITFTTYQGDCKGNDRVVFAQADGGKVGLTGCYRMVGDDFFVIWSDGEIYTYPWINLTLSSEMDKFLRRSAQ